MKKKDNYQTLELRLGGTILSVDISDLTFQQQLCIVSRIRKTLSVKLKKVTWQELWAIPRKTKGGSLRWSLRTCIRLI